MAKKFLTNLDMAKNQVLNIVLHKLASHPSNPVEGQIYHNTTDHAIYYWDGTAWVNVGGDITAIVAGDGLTGGGTAGSVTLTLNTDNVTLEISGDAVRIKDAGVSTAKIADSAVTSIKLADNAVSFAKIQDIATMTVIGRVLAGSGDPAEVSIINANDLTGASGTNLATAGAIKAYVDSRVSSIGTLKGGFDASTQTTFPAGTNPGDYYYVTAAGTVQGIVLNVGDMIVSNKAGASGSLSADWIFLESNRDQASITTLGLVILATAAEVQTGTDANKVVTPATLSGRTATESRTGLIEIATQTETDAGTDDNRAVTPLKLKTTLDARVGGYAVNIGDAAATSYTVTHNLNTKDVVIEVIEVATGETVITDVARPTVNTVTIGFAVAPALNAYRVIIKK